MTCGLEEVGEPLASDSNFESGHKHDDSCWEEVLDCPHRKGEHDENCGGQKEEGKNEEGKDEEGVKPGDDILNDEILDEDMVGVMPPEDQKTPEDRLHTPCQDEAESDEYYNQMWENLYTLMETGSTEEYEAAEAELMEHLGVCELCQAHMPSGKTEYTLGNPEWQGWNHVTWGTSCDDYIKWLEGKFNETGTQKTITWSKRPGQAHFRQRGKYLPCTIKAKVGWGDTVASRDGWVGNGQTGTFEMKLWTDGVDYEGARVITIEVPEGEHTGYSVQIGGDLEPEPAPDYDEKLTYTNTIVSVTPSGGSSTISNIVLEDKVNRRFKFDYNMALGEEAEAVMMITSTKFNNDKYEDGVEKDGFEITLKFVTKERTEVGIVASYEGNQTPYDGSEKRGYDTVDFTGGVPDDKKESLKNSITAHYSGTGTTVYDSDTPPTKPGTYKADLAVDGDLYYGTGTSEFTIAKKELTITGVTATARDYEEGKTEVEVTGGSLEGVVSGDDVSLVTTGAVGTMADDSAGTDKAVTVTGYILDGSNKDYYTVKMPEDVKVTINKIAYTDTENIKVGEVTLKASWGGEKTGTVEASLFFKNALPGAVITAVTEKSITASLVKIINVSDGKVNYTTDTYLIADTKDSYNVTISSQNYEDITAELIFSSLITKTETTITGISIADKVYDGRPVEKTGTAVVKDKETGAIVTGAVGTLSYLYKGRGGTTYAESATAPKDVGTYTLTVSILQDNPDYEGEMTKDFEITPKELTITGFTAAIREYKGVADKTVNLAGGVLNGVAASDSGNITVVMPRTGTMADGNVGTGKPVTIAKPSLDGAAKGNYTIADITGVTVDILAKSVSVTGDGTLAVSKAYDGTKNALAAHITGDLDAAGIVSGDSVTVKAVSGEYADAEVGTGKAVTLVLELDGAEKGNYRLSPAEYSFDGAVITKATASPSNAELAVTNKKPKTYEFDLSKLLPVLGGEKEMGTVTYAYQSRTENSRYLLQDPTVNGSKLTVPVAGVDSSTEEKIGDILIKITSTNYEDMTAAIKVSSVNKTALTVSGVTVAGGTYTGTKVSAGGTPVAKDGETEVPITGWVYEWSKKDGTVLEGEPKDAGEYKLTVSVPGTNTEYTGKQEIGFVIGKAALTVKLKDKTITKGGAIPSPEVEYIGLVGGDTGSGVAQLESGTLVAQIRNAADNGALADSSKPGSYKIKFTGSPVFKEAVNYTITTEEGTLTINDLKELHISGVTVSGNGGSYTGEEVVVEGTPTATDGDKEVPITGWVYEWSKKDGTKLDGAPKDAGEYKLTVSIPGTNGTYAGKQEIIVIIRKAALTVKPKDVTIAKGEPLPTEVPVEYEGLADGDDASEVASLVSGNLSMEIRNAADDGVLADSNTIGTYKIVFTGSPIFGEAANYEIEPQYGVLTISKPKYSGSSDGGSYSSSPASSLPKNYQGGTKVIGNTIVPDYTVEGSWRKQENGKWRLSTSGTDYVGCWVPAYNPYADLSKGQSAFDWFLFDADGNMVSGWYTDANGDTYYLNPSLDNTQGAMATGWTLIDGRYYYFNEEPDGRRGRMLKNTTTPDGRRVDENGVLVE